jgi:hypothetical protein
VRALQLAVLVVVILLVILPLLRRRAVPHPRRTAPDQLVKDPVCQTYVVRSRAVHPAPATDAPYFCSHECARRWAAGSGSRG